MPSCHSTNEIAVSLLKEGTVEEGTIIITDHQTRGQGQSGNDWEAEKGKNITCSLILKPKTLPIADQFILNVIISLGVADLVSNILSANAQVKWPNDVYYNREKIGGILINNIIKGNILEGSVVGIGLNVNQRHFSYSKATSLSVLSGNTTYDLSKVLASLILFIEKRYFQWKNDTKSLWKDYLARMYWFGEVRVYQAEGKYFTGIIRGITKSGQLIVEEEKLTREFAFKTIAFVK